MRAPPPLLAAEGRLTINGLMTSKSPVWGRFWLNTLGFTPDFDCEEEKDQQKNCPTRKKISTLGVQLAIFFVFRPFLSKSTLQVAPLKASY